MQKVGKTVKIDFKRDGVSKTVEMQVASDEQAAYRLVEMPNPTPQQMKVRDRWLMTSK